MRGNAWVFVLLSVIATNVGGQECGASLSTELVKRATADQTARNALIATPASKNLQAATLRLDSENTAFMQNVLAKCGWPRKSVVGSEAANAAWLLIQHADMNPNFQAAAANQMRSAVYAKEADSFKLALLVDRNRRLNDQPQVYGMQYFVDKAGVIVFYDIVNPADLDNRRKDIGIVPFYCMVTRLSKEEKNAAILWPAGILFQPADCTSDPAAR